uniref:CSON000344 protein n=1 Tax=Culicoides sonorensis TaxID=179676 RepID=A0A336MFG6_CULSO
MISLNKIILISVAIILVFVFLSQTEARATNHNDLHLNNPKHINDLRHVRVKRAPQNPITTIRPNVTTLTTTRSSAVEDIEDEEDDSSESGQGFGHTLLNIAKFMITQVRILLSAIMSGN